MNQKKLHMLEEELNRRRIMVGGRNALLATAIMMTVNGVALQWALELCGRSPLSLGQSIAASWLLCWVPSLLLCPFCLFQKPR